MNTHFYINSLNRTNKSSSPSNATVQLNKAIKADCAELSFFSMPNTWYNVTSYNNTFLLDAATITIPAGCYDLNQLLAEVLSLLPAGTTIAYNDVLNAVNITFLAAHTLDFTVSNSYILLGYLPQAYGAALSFTSTNPPKIYTTILLVKTNLGSNMVSDKGYHSSFIVPVNVNKGELLQFYNRSQFSIRPKVNNKDIKTIDIVLMDEHEQLLQGCGDFAAVIAVYEKNMAN